MVAGLFLIIMPKNSSFKNHLLGARRDKPVGISEKVINILKIISLISGGRYPSAKMLAEACEISERSVYRYLRIIEPIAPLYYDHQKGGYTLLNKDILYAPPLRKKDHTVLISALDVILRFPTSIKEMCRGIINSNAVSKLNEILYITHLPIPVSIAEREWQWMDEIFDASMEQVQLMIEYQDIKSDKYISCTIDPYDITSEYGHMFLYAYCHNINDFRWFALGRIKKIESLKQKFKKIEDMTFDEKQNSICDKCDEEIFGVKIRFSKQASETILSRKSWHPSEERLVLPSGKVELNFKVCHVDEIKPWIYSWGPHAEVIKPKWLKDMLKKDLKKTLSIYS